MKPASEKMSTKISSVNFIRPNIEIISNVTASAENEPTKIKSLLIKQIYSLVRWRESMLFMANNGIKEFIEIGPGKVLSGLVKRTLKNHTVLNINTNEDIESINDKFKNKKVIITGATGDIGKSLLIKFLSLGCKIVATGTNDDKLSDLKKMSSDVIVKKFNLMDHKIKNFIDDSNKNLGGIDILVNNAGTNIDKLLLRMSEEDWKKLLI